jgi:hypothetical protein
MSTPPRTQAPVFGHDIMKVIDGLLKAAAATGKGEFETTAEYEARRRALTAPQDTLVFVLPEVAASYNADGGTMEVSVMPERFDSDVGQQLAPSDLGKIRGDTFTLLTVPGKGGLYNGTNAMGAKRIITYLESTDYGLVITPNSLMTFNARSGAVFFSFRVDLIDARMLKPFLKLALVGRITEPRLYSNRIAHTPTFTEPWDTKREGLYVPFSVEEVRILDSRNGHMIANFTPRMRAQ